MSSIQLSFSLRVSSGVKTVHLLGSWDGYVGQLPLAKDKTSSKSGSWKGTFKFQGSTLEAGQRYWYYYIIDGYHVAHNPSVSSTVEPTTGRALNILDVPSDDSGRSHKSSSKSSHSSSSHKSSSRHSSSTTKDKERSSRREHRSSRRHAANLSVDIPKGRPLSISQIKAPKPMSPHATRHILDADYIDNDTIEELSARFGAAGFDEGDIVTDFSNSPVSSSGGSSLSYRSDNSSPSSLSGYSTPGSDVSSCTCERYGITRKGDRVKIDCGGERCGYGDHSSGCSSGSDDEGYEFSHESNYRHQHASSSSPSSSSSRRRGLVMRG